MPGLILKLKAREEIMINGVLVRNDDKNTRLCVMSRGAQILRLKDAIRPEEATTPLTRAYYIAQQGVSGELDSAEAAKILAGALSELAKVFVSGREHDVIVSARAELKSGNLYGVMRRLAEIARPSLKSAIGASSPEHSAKTDGVEQRNSNYQSPTLNIRR